jgi:hypothetical protein
MSPTGVNFSNVHAQGDINITGVMVGLTGPQIQELSKAAAAGTVRPLADKIVQLSETLGVTQGAALAMLRSLGHQDISTERLPDMLAASTVQILLMRQALSSVGNNWSPTDELRRQDVSALDAGAFGDATRLLRVIRTQDGPAVISGMWQGRSGRLSIKEQDSIISGSYDWYGSVWSGDIRGDYNDGVVRFSWALRDSDAGGVGFFLVSQIPWQQWVFKPHWWMAARK